jgi:hypothetical protein
MKDHLQKKVSNLSVQSILGTIKERLVEYRFNIDIFDHKEGRLKGRRNSLDRMVLGLYRNVEVKVTKDEKEGRLDIELIWGGLFFSNLMTFLITFLISYALLKGQGFMGVMISIPVGLIFVIINLSLFYVLRKRLLSLIKKDIQVLDRESKKKKRFGI